MSHTSVIRNTQFKSADVLRRAVEELNKEGIKVTFEDGTVPRAYFKDQPGMGKADHIIKLQDSPYDVGLYRVGDVLEPRCDLHAGYVQRQLGIPGNPDLALAKLTQRYNVIAAQRKYSSLGYMTERKALEDGKIKLVVTGFN